MQHSPWQSPQSCLNFLSCAHWNIERGAGRVWRSTLFSPGASCWPISWTHRRLRSTALLDSRASKLPPTWPTAPPTRQTAKPTWPTAPPFHPPSFIHWKRFPQSTSIMPLQVLNYSIRSLYQRKWKTLKKSNCWYWVLGIHNSSKDWRMYWQMEKS